MSEVEIVAKIIDCLTEMARNINTNLLCRRKISESIWSPVPNHIKKIHKDLVGSSFGYPYGYPNKKAVKPK